MSKTVRELLARHYPLTSFPEDGWPLLDYPVIEPSGVVLAVDREKLEVAACNAFNLACDDAPVDGDMLWRRTVDAILTSLAEDGFGEVEVAELRRLQDALEATDVGSNLDVNACRAIVAWVREAFKPHPPAKED